MGRGTWKEVGLEQQEDIVRPVIRKLAQFAARGYVVQAP